jgi:energy-coupling factor transporter ATP-binding protein EcfA2
MVAANPWPNLLEIAPGGAYCSAAPLDTPWVDLSKAGRQADNLLVCSPEPTRRGPQRASSPRLIDFGERVQDPPQDSPTNHGLPLRLVARPPFSSDEECLNPLWSAFLPVMEWVTQLDDPNLKAASANERLALYTAVRDGSHSPSRLQQFKASLPKDLQGLSDRELGYTEADVLHWILHVPSRPLLFLIGHRGSGKSTLLRYLFSHLPTRVASLRSVWPLFTDFRRGYPPFDVPDSPTTTEIVRRLYWEVQAFARRVGHPELTSLTDASNAVRHVLEPLHRPYGKAANDQASGIALDLIAAVCRVADSAGKSLLLVLDNIDQLAPEAIDRLFTLASTLCCETSAKAVLPQRPWNEDIHSIQLARHGGMISWRIDVPPPDIGSVLQNRFSASFPDELIRGHRDVPSWTAANGLTLEFRSTKDVLDSLLTFLQSEGITDQILQGICGANTTRKLAAVRAILRWHDLPIREFFKHETLSRAGIAPGETLSRHSLRVLPALLCAGHTHFIQGSIPLSSPILNILAVPTRPGVPAYTTMYRLLQILRGVQSAVRTDHLMYVMCRLGHDEAVVQDALQALLRWDLIYSGQHDWHIHKVAAARLSATGEYFITSVLEDPEYIYETVLDTPLPHGAWSPEHGDTLQSVRYESLRELLYAVMAQEQAELAALSRADAQTRSHFMRSVLTARQLSEIVGRVLHSKLQDGRVSKMRAVIAAASRHWATYLETDGPALAAHVEWVRGLAANVPDRLRAYVELKRFTLGAGVAAVLEGPAECGSDDDYMMLRLECRRVTKSESGRVMAIAEFDRDNAPALFRSCVVDSAMARVMSMHGAAFDGYRPRGSIWFMCEDQVLGGGSIH